MATKFTGAGDPFKKTRKGERLFQMGEEGIKKKAPQQEKKDLREEVSSHKAIKEVFLGKDKNKDSYASYKERTQKAAQEKKARAQAAMERIGSGTKNKDSYSSYKERTERAAQEKKARAQAAMSRINKR